FAAVAQQRPPLVAHPPVRVLAVADGQDDRVPLVALHPFQVLDEERLGRVFGEERLEVSGPGGERPAQRRGDALGVPPATGPPPPGSGRAHGPAGPPRGPRPTPTIPGGARRPAPPPRAAGSRREPRRGTWSARRRRSGRWRTPPAARPGSGSASSAGRSAA